jgi:beta-lactam-binding protein with PASTA domain
VLVQDPRPGTKQPEGSSVTLTVSTNTGKPQ